MKCFAILAVLASVLLLAQTEDDGKYRPETPVTTLRTVPTTRIPTIPTVPTAYPGWNPRRTWAYDPRYDGRDTRYDASVPRFDGRYDTRYNTNYYNPYNTNVAKPYRPYDYRTIRLDEKVDAKGYRYVYETVGGILAEEVGTFANIGLKNEGVRSQGSVVITDPQGVSFRIDYQVDSKDAYIPRGDGREAPRTPPSIVKLLALLESHK